MGQLCSTLRDLPCLRQAKDPCANDRREVSLREKDPTAIPNPFPRPPVKSYKILHAIDTHY